MPLSDTHAEEINVEITITVRFKTLGREVTHSNAMGYLRQAIAEQTNTELFGGITQLSNETSWIPQDSADNAEYLPCLLCQGLMPCACDPAEVEAHIKTGLARHDEQLMAIRELAGEG